MPPARTFARTPPSPPSVSDYAGVCRGQEPTQPQGEFSVFRDQALDNEGAAFWIESDCKPVERHLPYRLPHSGHVVSVVRYLIVGDQEVAVIAALQAHPVLERARVVAEMQGAGGPDSSQNPLLAFHCNGPLRLDAVVRHASPSFCGAGRNRRVRSKPRRPLILA